MTAQDPGPSEANPLDPLGELPPIDFKRFASMAEFKASEHLIGERWHAERRLLAALSSETHELRLPGFCSACGQHTEFSVPVPAAGEEPNWRERLACAQCGLVHRVRAAIEVFLRECDHQPGDRIYLTEQLTPLFDWFRAHFRWALGSEFVDAASTPGSQQQHGEHRVRHEDLTRLSLPNGRFQHVVCLDVLEHVPDYRAALRECARVLAPAGALVLSAPFGLPFRETLIRAEHSPNGELIHHEPPEYHGDPARPGRGVLAYYTFGWNLLEHLRDAGFEHAHVLIWWDPRRGYIGSGESMIVARKPGARRNLLRRSVSLLPLRRRRGDL